MLEGFGFVADMAVGALVVVGHIESVWADLVSIMEALP